MSTGLRWKICLKLFVPQEKIIVRTEEEAFSREEAGITAVTRLSGKTGAFHIRCELYLEDFREAAEDRVVPVPGETEDWCELRMAQLLYSLFVRLFGYAHDWGHRYRRAARQAAAPSDGGTGRQAADAFFREQLLVLDNKRALSRGDPGS